jgi:hypothetical protein
LAFFGHLSATRGTQEAAVRAGNRVRGDSKALLADLAVFHLAGKRSRCLFEDGPSEFIVIGSIDSFLASLEGFAFLDLLDLLFFLPLPLRRFNGGVPT